MTINERRFCVIGTIGNGSELRPIPRVEPMMSYHVIRNGTGEELAIRYTPPGTFTQRFNTYIFCKPILRQFGPSISN